MVDDELWLQALSAVGRCKTFEASADGYGRGEGFAVLALQQPGDGGALGYVQVSASHYLHSRTLRTCSIRSLHHKSMCGTEDCAG